MGITNATISSPQVRISAVPLRLGRAGLSVAVHSAAAGGLRLLAGAPGSEEWLDTAARRIVRERIGSDGQYLEQLYTFGHATADTRTVTVSYLALFRDHALPDTGSQAIAWVAAHEVALPSAIDRQVLEYALMRLRAKLGYTNIAFHLLPPTFTLSELQLAYEAVLDHPVDKRNFRRRMIVSGILDQLDEKRRDGSHRPAALYRFAARDDHAAYLTPPWAVERLEGAAEPLVVTRDRP